jgi:hypothetical protein
VLGLAREARLAADFAAAVLRSGEVSTTVVATPDVSARFLAQEEQGGGGGASQLVGGGWGGAERRRYSTAMAGVLGYWEENGEEEGQHCRPSQLVGEAGGGAGRRP